MVNVHLLGNGRDIEIVLDHIPHVGDAIVFEHEGISYVTTVDSRIIDSRKGSKKLSLRVKKWDRI